MALISLFSPPSVWLMELVGGSGQHSGAMAPVDPKVDPIAGHFDKAY